MIIVAILILITYFIPALLCTWLTYFLRSLVKTMRYRKAILSAGLTLGWAPGVITGGHGAFVGQMLATLIFFPSEKFDESLVFFNGGVLVITFLIVWYCIWAFKLDR